MSVILRDATPADFDAIARISVAAYQEYAALLTAEDWQKMHHSLSNVSQTANNADFILAETDGEIAGAIAYYSPEKSNPQLFNTNWASLRFLIKLRAKS